MILDTHGKPIRLDKSYARSGASYARKSLASWSTSALSADEDITQNLDTLRARSRDLYMSTPLATGAIKTIRTNVVGSGLALNAHIDHEKLGLSPESAKEWEKNTQREWALWAESSACDAGRTMNFYQMQGLVLASALMSGDCFVAMPYIKRPDNPYSLKVYIIESDRVCNPTDSLINPNVDIMQGIELGTYGEPVAYHIAKYHPNGSFYLMGKQQEWKRVPAFGAKTGRRNILHIMPDYERPAQRRGVPLLAPVMEALKQLERFTNAELTAAVISGLFTGFVTTQSADGLQSPFNDLGDRDKERNEISMGNGSMVYLQEGENVTFGSPGRPNPEFGGFVQAVCRQIGAALELPYELLVKNFTASYSASRASLLEAWKAFRMRRQWLCDSFCQAVYEEWLAEAVSLGRISAPNFFSDLSYKKAWSRAEWSGDAQGQLDPLKEANAAVVRINNGLSTREKEAAELTGLSFEVIANQLTAESVALKAITPQQGELPPVNKNEDEE
ncbi:phage portal protein [Anaerobiospirillum thomasii]|uniref:Phage portal protein, lambda family n=1 Tax=Anaerobiospirillum thomasii TaxID=179995 RepID=A0A2X0VKW2_9GAMM|nr:phage portal protein [Anaerobiospirillum thomasii]SPT70098.1 phage portal protein, lambda family [Anaerobiospirillum thomasii]